MFDFFTHFCFILVSLDNSNTKGNAFGMTYRDIFTLSFNSKCILNSNVAEMKTVLRKIGKSVWTNFWCAMNGKHSALNIQFSFQCIDVAICLPYNINKYLQMQWENCICAVLHLPTSFPHWILWTWKMNQNYSRIENWLLKCTFIGVQLNNWHHFIIKTVPMAAKKWIERKKTRFIVESCREY